MPPAPSSVQCGYHVECRFGFRSPWRHEGAQTVNKNRLHLLISGLVAAGSLIFLATLAPGQYSDFVRDYEDAHLREYIVQQTGRSFQEYQAKRMEECSRRDYSAEAAGSMFLPEETRAQLENGCVSGITAEQWGYARKGEDRAFVLRAVAVTGLALAAAWVIGLLLAKAIPAGFLKLWSWLNE